MGSSSLSHPTLDRPSPRKVHRSKNKRGQNPINATDATCGSDAHHSPRSQSAVESHQSLHAVPNPTNLKATPHPTNLNTTPNATDISPSPPQSAPNQARNTVPSSCSSPRSSGVPWCRVAGWLGLCIPLHMAALKVCESSLGSRWNSFPHKQQSFLGSKLLSTAHATVTAWVAGKTILKDRVWDSDVVQPYTPAVDSIFSLHLGYTLFEIGLFLRRREPLSIWFHHIADAIGSTLTMHYKTMAFFPTAFLVTEATVVSQNLLYWANALSVTKAIPYLTIIRAITYLTFRTFMGPMTALYASLGERLDSRKLRQVEKSLVWATAVEVAIMSVLNVKWSGEAIKSALRAFKKF